MSSLSIHERNAVYAELFPVPGGWLQTRILDRLILAFPHYADEAEMLDGLWSTPGVVRDPTRPRENLRVTIWRINQKLKKHHWAIVQRAGERGDEPAWRLTRT